MPLPLAVPVELELERGPGYAHAAIMASVRRLRAVTRHLAKGEEQHPIRDEEQKRERKVIAITTVVLGRGLAAGGRYLYTLYNWRS